MRTNSGGAARWTWPSLLFPVTLGILFLVSMFALRFETEEHRSYNLALDWSRFVLFALCLASSLRFAYRRYCRGSRKAQNVFLTIATFAGLYGAAEIGLRLSTGRYYWFGGHGTAIPAGAFDYHPDFGWCGVPHDVFEQRGFEFRVRVRNNAEGFRDRELSELRGDVPRVLFLGDSYAWGWGVDVENRYDRRAQAYLREQGIEIETYNTGTPGFGTDQEYVVLQELLPVCRPDVVALQYCVNDLMDNDIKGTPEKPKPYFTLTDDGRLTSHTESLRPIHHPPGPPPRLGLWRRISQQFLKFSHVYRYVFCAVSKWDALRSMPEKEREALFREMPNDPRAWRLTLALIPAIRDACEASGAQFLLLFWPPNERYVRFSPAIWYRETLTEFCKANDIAYLDLDRPGEGEPFRYPPNHYPLDLHFNAKGHDRAGRDLAAVIGKMLERKSPRASR